MYYIDFLLYISMDIFYIRKQIIMLLKIIHIIQYTLNNFHFQNMYNTGYIETRYS